jgi:hypothetical protein
MMVVTRHNVQISVSLVGLTLFIFFLANWLGFVPDEGEARLHARAELTEALAVQLSVAIQRDELSAIPATVKAMVEHNAHIRSVSLSRADGSVVTRYGIDAPPDPTAHGLPTLMKVPISKDGQPWGALVVNYQPFQQEYLWGFINASFLRLILFIALVGFVIYLIRSVWSCPTRHSRRNSISLPTSYSARASPHCRGRSRARRRMDSDACPGARLSKMERTASTRL